MLRRSRDSAAERRLRFRVTQLQSIGEGDALNARRVWEENHRSICWPSRTSPSSGGNRESGDRFVAGEGHSLDLPLDTQGDHRNARPKFCYSRQATGQDFSFILRRRIRSASRLHTIRRGAEDDWHSTQGQQERFWAALASHAHVRQRHTPAPKILGHDRSQAGRGAQQPDRRRTSSGDAGATRNPLAPIRYGQLLKLTTAPRPGSRPGT